MNKSVIIIIFVLIAIIIALIFCSCNKPDGGPIIGKVEDSEGNIYFTVEFEEQEWMKENLIISKYNNGDDIPQVQSAAEWAALTTGAYCYYYNENDKGYGKLYNWYAVNDKRGICPEGWHVPTDNDWNILVNVYEGINLAGGKLKAVATVPDEHPRWINPNANATDESEFSAVPGGFRAADGEFKHIGSFGGWWTSTDEYNDNAWNYGMSYNDEEIHRFARNKKSGYSVRCVRNTADINE
jgi:uncharacterized protein (TIGR02145 family)